MERARYLDLLATDGARLAAAASTAAATAPTGLDLAVPSCPGWTMRDLVEHVAEVYEHKLAAIALAGSRPDPWPPVWPTDREPLVWFDDAFGRLRQTLAGVESDAPSWSWWPDDQTAGFWIRRMAQETAVHRVDAELAIGEPAPIDTELALDGIDELLFLMLAGDWSDEPQPGSVGTVVVGGQWLVEMSENAVAVTGNPADSGELRAAAAVGGAPSDLLLWMYGRSPDASVGISGDTHTMELFRKRLARATQ